MAVVIPFESQPAPSIDRLVDLMAADMDRVNAEILSRTGSDVTMIPEVANHLINSGGKRLRPMLTLAMARLAGYGGDGHVKLAAAVEFMHTATLLHDDVVDESEMRRGRLAARMLWGNEASVLVGDFLLGQAFKMMVEVGSLRALDILSSAAAVIAEGEVMQLGAAKNTATTEDEYLAVIRAKTAELFAAACEVGPTIAGRSKDEQAACRSYGMNLGIAFQLVDDALDYGGKSAKLGKNVGDDFRDGKITLPVVLSYRRGSESERSFWRRTLEDGDATDQDLETAVSLMIKHRALEDTIKRARHYGSIATDALALFPDSAMKTALVEAVEFFDRAFELTPRTRRAHPPVGMRGLHPARRLLGICGRSEQPETGRARTRHPREQAIRRALQRAQHIRDHRLQLDCGGLQIIAPPRQQRNQRRRIGIDGDEFIGLGRARERGRRKRRKHILGRHRHAGVDQHRGKFRQGHWIGENFPDAAHHARPWVEAHRNVRAGGPRGRPHALVVERKPVDLREQPQRGRGIRRAAAEARRNRQLLVEARNGRGATHRPAQPARARP